MRNSRTRPPRPPRNPTSSAGVDSPDTSSSATTSDEIARHVPSSLKLLSDARPQIDSPTLESLSAPDSQTATAESEESGWKSFGDPEAQSIYWKRLRAGKYKLRHRNPDGTWSSEQKGLHTYEMALERAKLRRAELDAAEAIERKNSIYRKLGKEQRVEIQSTCLAWRDYQEQTLHERFNISREKLADPGDLSPKEVADQTRLRERLRDIRAKANVINTVCSTLNLVYFDELTPAATQKIVAHYRVKRESPYGYRVISFLKRLVRYVVVDCGIQIPNAVQILECAVKKWQVRPFQYLEPDVIETILSFFRGQLDEDPRLKKSADAGKSSEDICRRDSIRPIIELIKKYALRPRETRLLDVGDWNAKTRILTIRKEIRKTRNSTGNNVDRSFPVDPKMAAILTRCAGGRHPDDPLFRTVRISSKTFGRWSSTALAKSYSVLMKRLNIKSTLYDLRHTAATNIYYYYSQRGDDGIQMAKAILGHTEFSNAYKNYVHIIKSRKDLQRIADDYARSETFYLEAIQNKSFVDSMGSGRSKDQGTIAGSEHGENK